MPSSVESRRAARAGVVRLAQAQGPRLVERAGDQRRDGIVDIAGDAAALVFLQANGAPVQVTHLFGLGCAGFTRLLQIAQLVAQAHWPSPDAAPMSAISALPPSIGSPRRAIAAGQRFGLGSAVRRNGRAASSADQGAQGQGHQRRGQQRQRRSGRSCPGWGRTRPARDASPARPRSSPAPVRKPRSAPSRFHRCRRRCRAAQTPGRHGRGKQGVDRRIGALRGDHLPIGDDGDQRVAAGKGQAPPRPGAPPRGASRPPRSAPPRPGPWPAPAWSARSRAHRARSTRWRRRFAQLERAVDRLGERRFAPETVPGRGRCWRPDWPGDRAGRARRDSDGPG